MKPFRMILIGSLILLLLSSGIAYGAGWITKRLTNTPGDSVSPKVAVAGAAVYVVWQDARTGNNEIYFRRSEDSGVTWRTAQRLTDNAGASRFPAVAVDGSDVYVVWEDAAPGRISQIYFLKSEDGGANWGTAKALTGNQSAQAGRPAVAVVGSKLYVVWHNDNSARGGHCWISFRRSVDGGAHWKATRTLTNAPASTDARNPAVAALDSLVYVAWESLVSGNKEIFFRKSTNAGAGWQTAMRLTTNSGSSACPALAVQGSAVYLAWEDTTPGNREIFFRKSANRGVTWKPEMRLTENAGQSRAPALAVNDSSVYAVWEDNTPGNPELYHRKSTNKGADWLAIERLTQNSGASRGQAVAVGGSKIYVTWQDRTPGNNEIYVMHKTPGPNGISIISPTASTIWTKGETAEIRWQITEGAAGEAQRNLLGIDKVKIDLYRGTELKTPVVAETDAGAGKFSWPVPASLEDGTDYMIRITSTADDRIFRNSEAFRIGSIALPDLVVESMTHTPGSPTTATSVMISIVIRNAGNGPAQASAVKWWGGNYSVPALAPGAAYFLSKSMGYLAVGDYLIVAMADIGEEVTESSETNNTKTDHFAVTVAPDLIVEKLGHGPSYPTTADTITITALIKNSGGSTAGASTLSISAAGLTTTHAIPALAAGGFSSYVTRSVGPLAAGTYIVTALADSNGAVAESNETNNAKTDIITVTPPLLPDLVVSSLTGSLTATGGSFTAVVKNNGTGPAGASVLRMTLKMGITTIGTMDFSVPALAAGATHTQSYSVTAPILPGTAYTLTAAADATGLVTESNESNNTASITRTR
jgi:subtilase family serine protease